MPTKTAKNTTITRRQIYAKNRPFISRVTIDGIILGLLGLILAFAAIYCFSGYLKTAERQSEVIASAGSLNSENIVDENAKNLVLNNPTSAESVIIKKQYELSKLTQDIQILQGFSDDMHFFFLLSIIFGSLSLVIFVADFVYINHSSIRLAQKM